MANETTSPNMNLPVPGVSLTSGPTWATDLNSCLSLIDSHTHTAGSGVPITPDAISINANLEFSSNSAAGLKSAIFVSQLAPLTTLQAAYVSGVDLYYTDGAGNQVRLTQSGGVAGSPGSISNLVSPASAAYSAAQTKFIWQSDSNTAADMDMGAAIMRNLTASSFALTLQPPTLGANYSITLPALPASQKIMTLDASGNMSAPYTVDGSTITINANVIGVPPSGITTTQIAPATIVTGNIASATILGSNIAATTISASNIVNATLTGTQLSSSIDLPGNLVTENSRALVVSGVNAASSLAIVRGSVNSSGSKTSGEGFTSSRGGVGQYSISFTNAFASTPTVVACLDAATGMISSITTGTTATNIRTFNSAGSALDEAFHIIVIGPR